MKIKLKNITLFKELDDETLDRIESFTISKKFIEKNIIFYEGDTSDKLYFLVSGIVKLYKMSSHDKDIILKYFHPDEFIAEVANFEHIPYPATAKSFTDVEVLQIDFEKLKDIIYSNPKLAFIMQTSLIKKIRNLEKFVSTHLVLDAKERLIQYIIEHPQSFFKTKNIEIAEVLNITPETLSRFLRAFKNDDLIDIKTKTINKKGLLKFL
ncbi:MAG: Crp/Fnr family transcriptional regulator [Epsilonproteobacteria bacterium]|nr:MAG: Crp/Fnr family transcriptional regulator [Campylobacterota bacterium]